MINFETTMIKPLTEYFKVVGTPDSTMIKSTKRKPSLKKTLSTPKKNLKVSPDTESNVIDLVSDDESMCETLDEICKKELDDASKHEIPIKDEDIVNEASSSSTSTIIYTPETPRKSQTPQSSNSKSPYSRDKFYSPVKNRNLKLRTPSKIRKNLSHEMDTNKQEDHGFLDACAGMDDKTVFLLTIINKYLNTEELRPLLLKSSQDLLLKCMNSKKPGMMLICRLYWRKEGWYRLDKIRKICAEHKNCVDDPTIHDMLNNLTENGILEHTNHEGSSFEMGLEDYMKLLKHDELKTLCKDLNIKTSNKLDAIECLRSYSSQKSNISTYFTGYKSNNASRVLKMLSAKTGPCYKLTVTLRQTLYELYRLMYLGVNSNVLREKKLELTLIYDKIKRECYPDIDVHFDNASVVFKTRDDFDRFLQADNIYEDFLATAELSEKLQIIENVYSMYTGIDKMKMLSYRAVQPWLLRFTPPYLYVKILGAGLQELKKMKTEKHIALAIDISTMLISQKTFRQHKKAEWYAEKALILDKYMSNAEEAAKVLLEGFNSELSEAAKDALRPRARTLATRQTHAVSAALREALLQHAAKEQILEKNFNAKHIYKMPMDLNKSKGKIKFETRTASGRVVQDAEEFCINQYIAEGSYTHGGHWEGKMVTTMFFLLFWDVIYARLTGVRGVYLTHFQMFPLDLFMESFYVNRKALIEERLREIEESSVEDVVRRMCDTWNARPETELSGIARHIGWENIESLSGCMRPRALAAVCRRLATDYAYAHSGFPDLTLWNEFTMEVKFVEVKTDSDKPSMKQIQWMQYLQENGIETEFCYVGVNTTRSKARNNV